MLSPIPLDRRALTYNILIPSNYGDPDAQARLDAIGIEEAPDNYYPLVPMLRKYKNNPDAIQYIADMYE